MDFSANKLVQRYALERESGLIDSYIQHGPTVLQIKLGLSDEEWEVIFDYLVFEHNLLYKAVVFSTDFFIEEYVKYGAFHVREILNIEEAKYDRVWEMLFDFIAISNDALYYHFTENREKYLHGFQVRGGDYLRKVLCIKKEKYDKQWEKILSALHAGFCESTFDDMNFDHALKGFMDMINLMREHRMPISLDIINLSR